jgi:4-diphosphocytidyl-2C-methyl-D-erythritol kinase
MNVRFVPIADMSDRIDRKQKDRLAAVSAKSNQMFGSGGSVLSLFTPAEQTQRAEAGGAKSGNAEGRFIRHRLVAIHEN